MFKKKQVEKYTSKKDRAVGVPLLFALSGMRKQAGLELDEDIRNIAIVSVSPLKEIYALSYYIQAIKKKYPACKITFYTSSDKYEAVSLIESIDRIIKLYPDDINKSRKSIKKDDVYDILIDFGRWSRVEAIVSCYINATYKIGFRSENEKRHFPYSDVVDYDKEITLSENINKLMLLIGVDNYKNLNRYCNTVRNLQKFVVIDMYAPSVHYPHKQWIEEHWAYLISVLSKKGYRIALIGDKQHAETVEKFVEELGNSIDIDFLVGRLDFSSLRSEIEKASFVIGIDEDAVYIANFLGIPAVCLHYTQQAKNYAPVSDRFYSVFPNNNCIGCNGWYHDEKCVIDDNVCMKSISIKDVEDCIAKI